MRMLSGFGLFFSTACAVVACSSSDGGNGVNDVKQACETRLAWTQASSEACNACKISAYTSDECDCKKDEYRGLCNQQLVARNAEADCVYTIDECVTACREDCTCIDGCYADHAKCKPLQAAYDGCITDVCDDACK